MKKLFKHQEVSVKFFKSHNIHADFSDMGTGKTYAHVIWIEDLINRGANNILILCPKVLMKSVWKKELQAFGISYVVLDGRDADIRLKKINDGLVRIINYDGMKIKTILKALWNIKWDCIICDESTAIKNFKSQRAKAVYQITDQSNPKYRAIITGTPVPNDYMEIFGQYRFVYPVQFGTNFYRFRDRYFFPAAKNGNIVFKWGMKKLMKQELLDKINHIAIRHKKEDCLDIPEHNIIEMPVDLTPRLMKKYTQMKEDFLIGMNDGIITAANVLVKRQKLNQISNGFVIDEDEKVNFFEDNPKWEMMEHLVEKHRAAGQKIIIWSVYTNEIRRLIEQYNCLSIFGATSQWADISIESFNDPDICEMNIKGKSFENTDIIVCNSMSAGHGVNLYSASVSIHLSFDDSNERFRQANERMARPEQKNEMVTYLLYAVDTVDKMIMDSNTGKQKLTYNLFKEMLKR